MRSKYQHCASSNYAYFIDRLEKHKNQRPEVAMLIDTFERLLWSASSIHIPIILINSNVKGECLSEIPLVFEAVLCFCLLTLWLASWQSKIM